MIDNVQHVIPAEAGIQALSTTKTFACGAPNGYETRFDITDGTAPFAFVLPSTDIVRVTWQAGQWILIDERDTHHFYQAETAGEVANDLFHQVFVFDTRDQVECLLHKTGD